MAAAHPHGPRRARTARLRRLGLVLLVPSAALLVSACSTLLGRGSGPQVREVLVDYDHDEFATSLLGYFPRSVTVRPGDTVRFKQHWTGEPHSVTMGRLVDDVLTKIVPEFERYEGTPMSDIPPEVIEQVDQAMADLPPWMLDDDIEAGVNQNAAQPCYLADGGPPEDPATPCADDDQIQPAFTGRHSFYNSGFIPYEGPKGNVFEVPIAADAAPGTYYYYCNVHGPFQSGAITVVGADQDIPSQADVARQARTEIEAWAEPLREAYELGKSVDEATFDAYGPPETVRKPFAGFAANDLWVHGLISEFIPREMRVKVGEEVSWSFVGPHTVSFQVPPYFSQMQVEDDGTVVYNPQAVLPIGGPGAPKEPAEPEGEGGSPAEGEGPPANGEAAPADVDGPPERPAPPAVDAGRWDGQTFLSSGIFHEGTYSVTFTQPGSYRYACLIHPRMIGTVVVQ
ncbi:MAG: hypothetical protein M3N57_01070 [Actinomycetota bacterium]|nr:hypothetical protein [Actinomycetota bacterium]